MTQGFEFGENTTRRIIAMLRAFETSPSGFGGKGNPTRTLPGVSPIVWKNVSGETAPKYAAVEITDVLQVDGRIILEGDKPTGDIGARIFFNGHNEVEANKRGIFQQSIALRALFDDGAGANGDGYGPKSASWKLTEGRWGYRSLGGIPDETDQMYVESAPIKMFGKTDASITAGGSGTVSLWSITAGSSTRSDTTVNVTAYYDIMHNSENISSGKWVQCEFIPSENKTQIVGKECE